MVPEKKVTYNLQFLIKEEKHETMDCQDCNLICNLTYRWNNNYIVEQFTITANFKFSEFHVKNNHFVGESQKLQEKWIQIKKYETAL